MVPDPEESQAIRRLVETKFQNKKNQLKSLKKRRRRRKDTRRNWRRTSKKFQYPYGPSFVPDGRGIKKPTRRSMVAQIQSLPITSMTVFQVSKKLISSNHESISRCLEFCHSFVTTCNGGCINLWDALSPKDDPSIIGAITASAGSKQRWPEDVAFFPNEDRLVAVYKNPDVDRQVALVTFGRQNEAENNVKFLIHETTSDLKIKHGVRRVMNIPDTSRFITAGEDRSVIVWDVGDEITRTLCHNSWHKNDINGFCRVKNKSVVVSAGLASTSESLGMI